MAFFLMDVIGQDGFILSKGDFSTFHLPPRIQHGANELRMRLAQLRVEYYLILLVIELKVIDVSR